MFQFHEKTDLAKEISVKSSIYVAHTMLEFHEFSAHQIPFPSSLLHTVWKNEKFGLTEKIFRQINSLVICLVKPLLSRNFCRKSVRLNFHNFHTVPHSAQCGKMKNLVSLKKYFVKSTL